MNNTLTVLKALRPLFINNRLSLIPDMDNNIVTISATLKEARVTRDEISCRIREVVRYATLVKEIHEDNYDAHELHFSVDIINGMFLHLNLSEQFN